MDIKKLLSDTGAKLNRVVQQAEETFLTTEKTEYDTEYLDLLKKVDLLKYWTERFVNETSKVLEPNMANRLENKVMEKMEKPKERSTALEAFGTLYESAAEPFGRLSPEFGKYLTTFGNIQVRVGVTNREFMKAANDCYVVKLRNMLDLELKKFAEEHTNLENLRLDLDIAKNKLKKNLKEPGKQQAEDQYQKAQKLYDDQMQTNKILFRNADDLIQQHKNLMKSFVEIQKKHYAECQKELERLERQL